MSKKLFKSFRPLFLYVAFRNSSEIKRTEYISLDLYGTLKKSRYSSCNTVKERKQKRKTKNKKQMKNKFCFWLLFPLAVCNESNETEKLT